MNQDIPKVNKLTALWEERIKAEKAAKQVPLKEINHSPTKKQDNQQIVENLIKIQSQQIKRRPIFEQKPKEQPQKKQQQVEVNIEIVGQPHAPSERFTYISKHDQEEQKFIMSTQNKPYKSQVVHHKIIQYQEEIQDGPSFILKQI